MLRLLSALLLSLWVALAGAEALQPVPALQARVTDLTATLTPEQHRQLEARLAAFEAEKGSQIAVLIVPTVKPEAIEQYSIRVVEQWKLGRQSVDDGVLLLIAKQDKKLRIEVGYGLEGVLNDATARRIIAETITPRFKEGKFYEGIDAGLGRIIAVVGGEALPPSATVTADGSSASSSFFSSLAIEELLIVGLAIVTGGTWLLRKVFGRFLGAAFAGGIAGSIALFFVTSMFVAGIVGFIVFVFSLLSGGRSSPLGGGLSSGLGGYGGSSGSDSGWSSSSSDSFSGGGGDFGGGGASGDW